ncbi:glycosyltransferase family 4 protein [Cytobacillus oceanisediminis]|uniref:glycosyltransferase family 4 protein n=1 Tax=Cytobacillus oceanisediminis TaxID=665099 RepID=UPI0020401B45|nr:glycosyltransferase family 4 protein [Cytobacillus oceanisediminis]MCM3403622.1 glycosyltransferase family 4 protein [Cytobacillus oceanisediminis]MDK7666873.1 glycosyltransferase family 4 protein [Cytobacillus oceanisediminis]
MNIWIFNHYAAAPEHVGGTRHYDLAKQLCKKGHSVTIFASSFNHFSKEEMVFKDGKRDYQLETIEGVNFNWVNTPPYRGILGRARNILSYTIKSFQEAKRDCEMEKPDLIIGSSVHPLAAFIGYLLAKKAKCCFYFEERDLWPQTFVDFGKISAKNPLAVGLYKFEKFLYQKADRIIVLFDKAQNYVRSKGTDHKKVICLPNGVDLSNYHQFKRSDSVDRIFKGIEDKFVVVYTGSHGIANHLEPVIELFSRLEDNPKLHLIMVGDGARKKELMSIANEKGMTNITFADSIPKSEIPYLLNRANMSIISIMDSPLYKWGFSMNKIYDYMAAGLPIIMMASPRDVGSLMDVPGIQASNVMKENERAIMHYFNNPEELKHDSRLLKDYVRKHYSWEVLSDKLENYIYQDIYKEEADEKII